MKSHKNATQGSANNLPQSNTKRVRPSSKISQVESDAILAQTDQFKTGGTFFFTAGPETLQSFPESKIDRRIITMYQRQLWDEKQNGGPITCEGDKVKTSISKLKFYNEWLQHIKNAKKHTQVRENEMNEEQNDENPTAVTTLKRDLLRITADSYK